MYSIGFASVVCRDHSLRSTLEAGEEPFRDSDHRVNRGHASKQGTAGDDIKSQEVFDRG